MSDRMKTIRDYRDKAASLADPRVQAVYVAAADFLEAQARFIAALEAWGVAWCRKVGFVLLMDANQGNQERPWTALNGKYPEAEGGMFECPFAHGATPSDALRNLADVLEAEDPIIESRARVNLANELKRRGSQGFGG